MIDELRNAVYEQGAVSDAINRTLDGVRDDLREDAARVIGTLINETVTLVSNDPLIPTAAILDPASPVWQAGTKAFITRNQDAVDNNLRICEYDLHGWTPREGRLIQLVYTVALQTMVCLAAIRCEQTQ